MSHLDLRDARRFTRALGELLVAEGVIAVNR
jgi:hypothetical protein